MQKNLIFIISLVALVNILISGCEPHRIDIQQGNRVDPEAIAQLKTGMSRSQVVFLLGTPLLQDPFHNSRWDYIYYLKPGNKPVRLSRITLHFDGDRLSRIDDSAYKPSVHSDKKAQDFDATDPPPAPEKEVY